MKTLNTLVDATLAIEKLRVALEVRRSHLKLKGKTDPETDELHRRLVDLESYVDGHIAVLLATHPAYSWFSRVLGVGGENIGKIVGLVRVAPEIDFEGKELSYADTISALWKFAGFSVEEGRAPKRVKGEKLSYNSQLRSMCWRLGSSLLKAGLRKQCVSCGRKVGETKIEKAGDKCPYCGADNFKNVAVSKFGAYYLREKEKYLQRYANEGIKIVPATKLPKNSDGKRYEPEGVLSEGHVHNQALRKMIKLFLACLWLTWRKAEGLPVTAPYAIDKLGHSSIINTEEMLDK